MVPRHATSIFVEAFDNDCLESLQNDCPLSFFFHLDYAEQPHCIRYIVSRQILDDLLLYEFEAFSNVLENR